MKTDGGIALVDATGDFALMGDLGLAVGEEGTGDLDRERTPMSLLYGTGALTRFRVTEDAMTGQMDSLDQQYSHSFPQMLQSTHLTSCCVAVLSFLLAVIHPRYSEMKAVLS